ncbi:universal stress protein [bacterium]|mgnify:FL=1|jgi:nucleotide-binding universal stress UspA family protein|nr:universal stress protein [bacterium]
MKKILVPTDFSENSKCAFNYAIELAKHLKAEITVVHIYHPSINNMNEFMIITDNELEAISRKLLDEFVKDNKSKSQKEVTVANRIEQKLEIGFVTEKLINMSKSGEYDMIIMGATGSTGLLEMVFGKVSLHVAQSSACPVLLIPAKVRFEPIREIMYAIEYELVNESCLVELEILSKNLEANVHLVHVYEGINKKSTGLKSSLIEKIFQQKVPNLKFTMEAISSDSVVHGLEEYARMKEMDWMVLVKSQRKLWQQLLHSSKTNKIILDPQIPLMVMH